MTPNRYVIGDAATGEILRSVSCDSDQLEAQVHAGELLDLSDNAEPATHYFAGGIVVAYTAEQVALKASPVVESTWSNAAMAWVDARAIQQQRTDAILRMKEQRDATLFGGFDWDGSRFDSDERAQSVLLGLYVDSKEPAFEPQPWRLADNSWRVLDAADAAGVWAALRAHLKACFGRFAVCEAQIQAAATSAAIKSIQWAS